jgi:EAL domain-containing protein (putative c-di-GMP-specific phosphodiesterase class I)
MNLAKSTGVRLALDDVTLTGGANLAIWARAPFDVIKIDRSLVAQIGAGMPSPHWLGGITALVQSAKLLVIAEGVETQLQQTALSRARIQEAQGFLFSPPLSAERFIRYHRASPDGSTKQPLTQSGDV